MGFSLCTGLAAALLMRMDVPNVVLLLAFVLMCAWWGWLTLRRARALRFLRGLRRVGHATSAPLDEAEIDEISPPH